jgi:hypothetical protein
LKPFVIFPRLCKNRGKVLNPRNAALRDLKLQFQIRDPIVVFLQLLDKMARRRTSADPRPTGAGDGYSSI